MPEEEGLQRLGQVLEEMEPIGNLDGIRCARSSCLGIAPTAIPTDDLGMGMMLQPRDESRGLAIREQINHTAALQIHQDGAVPVPAAEGEVVDAQDTRIVMLGQ